MWHKKRNPVGDFSKTSEESRWQAMALAWHSASTAWLASGPGIKQLLGRRNCRNCLHNWLKPVKYQTVPGTEQAPSEDGFFSLCFLSCYSMGWHCLQPIQIHRCSPVLITGLLFLFEPLVYVCVCVWRGVCVCVCTQSRLVVATWTVACQAPLFMEFSWQEYWSGLPFPTPGDLPNPGIEPASLVSPQTLGPT